MPRGNRGYLCRFGFGWVSFVVSGLTVNRRSSLLPLGLNCRSWTTGVGRFVFSQDMSAEGTADEAGDSSLAAAEGDKSELEGFNTLSLRSAMTS